MIKKTLITTILTLFAVNSFAEVSDEMVAENLKNSIKTYTVFREVDNHLYNIVQSNILAKNTSYTAITRFITDYVAMIHQLEVLTYFINKHNMEVVSIDAINYQSISLKTKIQPFLSIMFDKLAVNDDAYKKTMNLYNKLKNARTLQDQEDIVERTFKYISTTNSAFGQFLEINLKLNEQEFFLLDK